MATYQYHQSKPVNMAQSLVCPAIKHKDLDDLVNYTHELTLEENHLFNCQFVYRYGMPSKWPTGKWGYLRWGDVGGHYRPEAIPGDFRMTFRYPEMPRYHIEFGSIHRLIFPITEYVDRDKTYKYNSNEVIAAHFAALKRALRRYHEYLVYKIFVGTQTKADTTFYCKRWAEEYVEPADGAQNGYRFYLSHGWGSINYSEVKKAAAVKTHQLKAKLEAINKLLRTDSRKLEVDATQDPFTQKNFIKQRVTPDGIKTYALFRKARECIEKIGREGAFEKKYLINTETKDDSGLGILAKWKNDEGEEVSNNDQIFPSDPKDLVVIMNRQEWLSFTREVEMNEDIKHFVSENEFGAQFMISDLLDKGECFILDKDLIQIWVLPLSISYEEVPYLYVPEETKDYIYAFDHSLDVIPFKGCMWLKSK